jgi:hypothetical protein
LDRTQNYQSMNIEEYKKLFKDILDGSPQSAPYDTAAYLNYVKLNQSRMKRWAKKGELLSELEATIKTIDSPQTWVLITEPWCGDAANSVPYVEKIAALNPLITLEVQLRDSDSEIDNYLTNGGKSIPKLIIRDSKGKDMATWGPRPDQAQALVLQQKKSTASQDEKYAEILHWYKEDNGVAIQKEIRALLV